jgi:hypothetical protein
VMSRARTIHTGGAAYLALLVTGALALFIAESAQPQASRESVVNE